MRLSLLSAVVIFLFFPFTAQSLGLGELSVDSKLNAPLDAKIDLSSVTPQDLESLDIRLASARDFQRSDIEKIDLLQKLNFKLINNNGSPYIHVTTNSVLREPFINFLIDIQWHAGRLLREYTVLLDLPEVASHKAKATPQAHQSQKNTTEKNFSANANFDADTLSYGPTLEQDTLWSVASRMRPSADISMSQMMLAIQAENPQAFNKNNINGLMSGYNLKISSLSALSKVNKKEAWSQVKQQDNKWKEITSKSVANKAPVKPSVPVKQIIQQQADNSQAKAKLELLSSDKVSDAKDVGALPSNMVSVTAKNKEYESKLALYEERIQTQSQENEELKLRILELEKLVDKRENLVNLKNENLAIIQSKAKQDLEQTAKQDQLMENHDSEQASVSSNKNNYIFNDKLFTNETIAKDELGADNEVADEVNSSVPSTEETTSTIDSLDKQQDSIKTEMTEKDPVAGKVETQTKPEETKSEETKSEETKQEETKQEETKQEETKQEETKQEETKQEETKQTPSVTDKISPVKTPDIPVDNYKPKSTLEVVMDIFMGIYKDNFTELLIAMGAFFTLLLASIFSRRKNKDTDDGFQESILTNSSVSENKEFDNADDNLDTADMGESTGLENETSFLSDFSSSELDGLQPDDVDADPLSEADVFMVYGRYDQAEELLKGVIEKQPERLDYQMKLLEVFHGDKRQDAFELQLNAVRTLIESSDTSLSDSNEWAKVQDLSKDFNLDSEQTAESTSSESINSVDDIINSGSISTQEEPVELSDDEIDVDDLERQLNEFEAMLGDDFDDNDALNDPSNSDIEGLDELDESNLDDLPSLDEDNLLQDQETAQEEKTQVSSDQELSLDDVSLNMENSDTIDDASVDIEMTENSDSIDDLATENTLDDIELNLEDLSDSLEEPAGKEEAGLDDIELNLEDLSDSLEEPAEKEIGLDDIELDLEDLSDSLEEPAGKEEGGLDDIELNLEDLSDSLEEPAEEEGGLDDIELDLEDLSDSLEEPAEEEGGLDDIELDLEDLSDSLEESSEEVEIDLEDLSVAVEGSDNLDETDIPLADMELDLDGLTDDLEDISADLSLEDDIDELDKIGSTLDLAKARIEMGDEESKNAAIRALEVVLKEGDEEQRLVAQKLLDLTK